MTTTNTRKPFDVRSGERGADIWSGPTDHDIIFGTVYDKGPGSYDHEEMAKVWAAAYPVMFPALARIRDRARTGGKHALLDLAWIADEAAAALPGPTIGDLNGTSPAATAPAPAAVPSGWLPIATAPKDGRTAVDLWFPSHGRKANWRWYRKNRYWGSAEPDRFSRILVCDELPTHWMPIPPAPTASPAASTPDNLPLGYIPIPQGLHPDTARLVCAFAEAVAAKLRLSEIKYGWTANWMRKDWRDELAAELLRHVHKGDPRDVAAYCAFAWHHQWSIAPAQPASTEALTVLQKLVGELDSLMDDSEGVAGLHKNGDIATWDDLMSDGQYPWLGTLDEARAVCVRPEAARAAAPADGVVEALRELVRLVAMHGLHHESGEAFEPEEAMASARAAIRARGEG